MRAFMFLTACMMLSAGAWMASWAAARNPWAVDAMIVGLAGLALYVGWSVFMVPEFDRSETRNERNSMNIDVPSGVASGCAHCGKSFEVAKPHYTEYQPGRSCLPLCEPCWASMKPDERLAYYLQHCVDAQLNITQSKAVIEAVEAGK